jgi:hypothetical protein
MRFVGTMPTLIHDAAKIANDGRRPFVLHKASSARTLQVEAVASAGALRFWVAGVCGLLTAAPA